MTQLKIQGPQGELATVRMGSGQGLPILFLHADPGRAAQWEHAMETLSRDYPVAAYDSRGAGDSAPAADGDYSYAGRALDVNAVAEAFHFKKFVIVAHSAAAAVALAYAARHPDRVAGILMVDPLTDPRVLPAEVLNGFVKDVSGPKSLEAFTTYVGSIAGKSAAVRARVLADATKIDPGARVGLAKALRDWNPDAVSLAANIPIFILSAPASDNAGALYRLRPDIPHRVVQTEGHWLQLDHPSLVETAIKDFVVKIEGT